MAWSPTGIYLCQKVCAWYYLCLQPPAFPLDPNHLLTLANREDYPDPKGYRRLVGHLIYLAVTKPDISYAIHVLTQFTKKSKQSIGRQRFMWSGSWKKVLVKAYLFGPTLDYVISMVWLWLVRLSAHSLLSHRLFHTAWQIPFLGRWKSRIWFNVLSEAE